MKMIGLQFFPFSNLFILNWRLKTLFLQGTEVLLNFKYYIKQTVVMSISISLGLRRIRTCFPVYRRLIQSKKKGKKMPPEFWGLLKGMLTGINKSSKICNALTHLSD